MRSLGREVAVAGPIVAGVLAGMAAAGAAFWAPPASWQFRLGLGLALALALAALAVAAVPLVSTSPRSKVFPGVPVARFLACPAIAVCISFAAITIVLTA